MSASMRLTLMGIFLLVVVIITALVDLAFHIPSPYIVIGVMLVATVIAAQVISGEHE